jgi:hypothetical protein
VDARVPFSRTGLVDVGLYDLGQDTRLNLQAGNYLFAKPDEKPGESAENLLIRYGLYASKIGGGLEYNTLHGYGFRADLWDTSPGLAHLNLAPDRR